MAYAPEFVSFDRGDGSIVGRFTEKDFGHVFEFSKNPAFDYFSDPHAIDLYPHLVWVNPDKSGWLCRYARVLKTVAYVVVDEAADGTPVVEKWRIKRHRIYVNPEG